MITVTDELEAKVNIEVVRMACEDLDHMALELAGPLFAPIPPTVGPWRVKRPFRTIGMEIGSER